MTALDWYIAIALLAGMIALGIGMTKYVKTMADFLVADRKVRKYLGLGSQRAEGVGLAGIAGYAQQGFQNGFAFLWVSIITKLWSIPLFGIFGFGIKRFRATKCITIAQYVEERYRSKGLRLLIGIVLALSGIINMSILPKVGSSFLVAFTGLPETLSVAGCDISTVTVGIVVLLGLAVFFTFLGGMITVIVTDFAQAMILISTLIFVGVFTIFKFSPSAIHQALQENLGNGAYNPFSSGSYGFTWILWIFLLGTFVKFAFAPAVQKLASSDSPETARKMDLIAAFFGTGQASFILLLGIGALVLFGTTVPEGQDPENYRRFIAAIYLRQTLPPILMGITLAAMLFASISTNDSYLLAWSTVIVNDIITPNRKEPFSSKEHMRAIRITIVSIAVAVFLWSAFYKAHESIIEYMYMSGTIMAGIGISVLFGLYWKRATAPGAYAAIITCVIIPLSDLLGKQFIENYPLTTQQSGLFAMLGGIMMMVVVSLLTSRGAAPGWVDYGITVKQMDAEEKARSLKERPVA
jgi:SSS family solute:Na+ symporter